MTHVGEGVGVTGTASGVSSGLKYGADKLRVIDMLTVVVPR